MTDTGPFQATGAREWFDSLPNPDYWTTCAALREQGRARTRDDSKEQTGEKP